MFIPWSLLPVIITDMLQKSGWAILILVTFCSSQLVALKLVYFIVERGIPKLELKSPTTVVLLDLSYFHAL